MTTASSPPPRVGVEPVGEGPMPGPEEPVRFAVRSAAGLAGTIAAGVAFALALALVTASWSPLQSFDADVVTSLNAVVASTPWLVTVLSVVTDLGGAGASWLVLSVAVVWLLVRRSPRLAIYVAVTGLGATVLSNGIKALVERARPVVDVPVASAPGASFPSGHSLGSTVTYGVLLLVFLPVVPPRLRKAVIAAAVVVVVAVGLTRVALAVHYPSDVVGGWSLGVLWLAVTATAFRRWRAEEGRPEHTLSAGLEPEDRAALDPAPARDAPLPAGWRSAAELLVGAVAVSGALAGLGLLVTGVLGAVPRLDDAVIRWFVTVRSEVLTLVAGPVSALGGTVVIVAVLLAAAPLAVGLTRRWAPGVFLLVATAGETAIFLAVSSVIGRPRPPVEHLTPELAPTASFPSGHVAATLATYGGIALLVAAWTRGPWGRVALSAAVVLVIAVAVTRLYKGVHYPSDVVASVLYAGAWLAVCWVAVRPGRGSPSEDVEAAGPSTTS